MKPLVQERATAANIRTNRTDRVEVVVVSSDDALLIELGPTLGNRYRTHTVDTPAEISATVQAARWIGLVDVASLPDARGAVARMELQFHRCPLILVAPDPEEWSAAIARGAATVALSRQQLAGPQLLEALATAEARLHREAGGAGDETAAAGGAGAPAGAAARSRSKLLWVCVLLGLAAGGAGWVWHRSGEARAPRPAAHRPQAGTAPAAAAASAGGAGSAATGTAGAITAAGGTANRPQTVLELLSAARVAFGDQRLLLPPPDAPPRGDSALELYTQVLSQDPGNDEALDGVRRLFAAGKDRIQADLAAGKLDDAARLLAFFKAAGVSAATLSPLSASIDAARPKWLQIHVQQSIATGNSTLADQQIGQLAAMGVSPSSIAELRRALQARQLDAQLTTMGSQVKAAIDSGALLDPADDNARTRLNAMRTLGRTQPQTLAATHALQAALLEHGLQALHAGQTDVARRYVDAAAELGDSTAIGDARRQLQAAAALAARRSAAAAARTHAAQVSAPVTAAAPAPRPAATAVQYIPARPVRPLPVTYPDNVTVGGYVIIQFTLEPNGAASNPAVVESQPRGVFDRVALAAVKRGRYDTSVLNAGRPMQARILLRFRPN